MATEMTEEFLFQTAGLRSDMAKDLATIHDVQLPEIPQGLEFNEPVLQMA
jgi:hypothetical protein